MGNFGHEEISSVLKPIVERDPAFGAEIVDKGLIRWALSEDVSPPPALECGKRIREAAQAWAIGIRPLAQVIGPRDESGRLPKLGVFVEGASLQASWVIDAQKADVFLLDPAGEFRTLRLARPGRQSGWAWRWALEDFLGDLTKLLQRRALPVTAASLLTESAWEAALALTGRGSLFGGPIPFGQIDAPLQSIPPETTHLLRHVGGIPLPLAPLRNELQRLKSLGAKELPGPWPGPDQSQGGWVWDLYSDQRLPERTRRVFEAALAAYREVVAQWFAPFSKRLALLAQMPVRVKGRLEITRGPGRGSGPTMQWFKVPLPAGSANVVEIELGATSDFGDKEADRLVAQQRRLRPDSPWLPVNYTYDGLHWIFTPSPVTEIVYKWLWRDLERTAWVHGMLGERPW